MRRKRIAVLMASIDREYQQEFTAELEAAGFRNNTDICIFNSEGHMNVAISTSEIGESLIYDLPDLSDFDGIISMPATMGSRLALRKIYEVIRAAGGKPHISIDVPQAGAVTIRFDDRISMKTLTEHLITEHGARRIAFVSGPAESGVSGERLKACREVLKSHGLRLDDSMVYDGQWTRVGGRAAAEKILQRKDGLPDAIICANDDMALSVIDTLNRHGIRVPADVAVTGFDALKEALIRGVTTIRRPVDEAARKAVEILQKWISGEITQQEQVILSTIPVYGDSCGCVRSLADTSEKLRILGTERWDREDTLARVSMFSGSMAGAGDEKEAREKIQEFADSWNIREFYLCADPSICRETDLPEQPGYPREMLLLYGKRKNRQYEAVLMSRRELVPSLNSQRKDPLCLVFCPLYYRERSLGYVAMNPGGETGAALYPVLMLLNGALMSLYLQTNLKRSAAVIEHMAIEDIMTGLLNRRGYMAQAPAVLEKARREKRIFAMLSADMNHMKDINDRYGHLAGDEAICKMGKALKCLEQEGMIPVHISGDEFLAYGIVSSREEAADLVNQVNRELEKINGTDQQACGVSASFGVYAAVPQEGEDLDYYMTMADRLMYADKKKRKYGRRWDDHLAAETEKS